MDQRTIEAWRGLVAYSDRLQYVCHQLALRFPETSGWLIWRETILASQNDYRRPGDVSDMSLQIAEYWLGLADEGRLDVEFDPSRGLVVSEAPASQAPELHRKDLERFLFKKLAHISDGQWLFYQDFNASFKAVTGQPLKRYLSDFKGLVRHLAAQLYIVADDMRGQALRMRQGLKFDDWSELMSKPSEPSQAGAVYNFHAPVAAVQSGDHAVANVQQTVGSNDYGPLIAALKAAHAEFVAASLPDKREEMSGFLDSVLQEAQKEKPNNFSLKSMLAGLASTVQTLGSSSDAYKAVVSALAVLGFPVGS